MTLPDVTLLSEVISAIQAAEDREALVAGVLEGIRPFGFANFSISINVRHVHDLLTPELSSMDGRFFGDFDRNGFVGIDPVLANSVSLDRPFSWTSHRECRDSREARLVEYLRSFPLTRGLVLPLPHAEGRASTANFSSGADVRFDEATVHCLSIIACAATVKAEGLGLCADDSAARLGDADLSARQIEILHWAAQGKSNGDIAVIVGQSKRAVDWHMSEILRKLKVSSRSQAVALAGTRR